MKKKLFMMMCCLLMIISAGCSSESDPQNTRDDMLLLPLLDKDLEQGILNFFDKELPSNREEKSKVFFTSIAEDEEECLLINSNEEFQNAYKGSSALPQIDFQHYTLILGKLYLDASYMLESQYLTNKESEHIIVLTFKRESSIADMLPLYFWGIYPKINTGTVTIKKEH